MGGRAAEGIHRSMRGQRLFLAAFFGVFFDVVFVRVRSDTYGVFDARPA